MSTFPRFASLDSDSLDRNMPPVEFLADLPRDLQCLPRSHGVLFDLRGVVQLNNMDQFPGIPNSVDGIQIRQKCRRLTFLQATHYKEQDNTQIGVYVVHYSASKQETIPIVYGKDVLDWYFKKDDPVDVSSAHVVWTGTKVVPNGVRVFSQSWENPLPEAEIQSLDFQSKLTKCAPFLIAITAE